MTAGLLLTGGASRRLGVDKAELRLAGERLADRSARVLAAVCQPALEVGPGRSSLAAVAEPEPGQGPLAALVAGADALAAQGYTGPVLLLAVDLPLVTEAIVEFVASYPGDATVVPVAAGEPQTCCARYASAALVAAADLVADGERSLRRLLAATTVDYVPADANVFADVDTPADARRLALE